MQNDRNERSESSATGLEELKKRLAVGLKEAEKLIGISKHTLRQRVRRGQIRAARIGRRILIPMAEIERLIALGPIPAAQRKVRKAS
jgi:excisionase family DNA binding protein